MSQFNVTKTPATKREKLKQKFEDTVPKATNYTSGKRFESKFGESMQNLKKFSADKFSSFEGWDDFPKRQKFAFKRTNIPLDDSLPQGNCRKPDTLKDMQEVWHFPELPKIFSTCFEAKDLNSSFYSDNFTVDREPELNL